MPRMAIHDPLGFWLLTSLLVGLAAHVAIVSWRRRAYAKLRAAYTSAVATAQESGSAEALGSTEELHRQFLRATPPTWLSGLGAHVRAAFASCFIAGIAVMIGTGQFLPVLAGIAFFTAIGLRRILIGSILMLVLFASLSLTRGNQDRSTPRPAQATIRAPAP